MTFVDSLKVWNWVCFLFYKYVKICLLRLLTQVYRKGRWTRWYWVLWEGTSRGGWIGMREKVGSTDRCKWRPWRRRLPATSRTACATDCPAEWWRVTRHSPGHVWPRCAAPPRHHVTALLRCWTLPPDGTPETIIEDNRPLKVSKQNLTQSRVEYTTRTSYN